MLSWKPPSIGNFSNISTYRYLRHVISIFDTTYICIRQLSRSRFLWSCWCGRKHCFYLSMTLKFLSDVVFKIKQIVTNYFFTVNRSFKDHIWKSNLVIKYVTIACWISNKCIRVFSIWKYLSLILILLWKRTCCLSLCQ